MSRQETIGSVFGALLSNGLPILIGFVFLFVGLLTLYSKVPWYTEWKRVKTTPTTTASGAAVGRTDLEGSVSAVSEPPVAPFTNTQCAYACWEISKRSNDSWEQIDAGDCSTNLLLEDETGRVLVRDPGNPFDHSDDQLTPSIGHQSRESDFSEDFTEYSIRYDSERKEGKQYSSELFISDERVQTTTVDADEQPPRTIREHCKTIGVDPDPSHRRRYREFCIPEGQTVYVSGEVRPIEKIKPDLPDHYVKCDSEQKRFLFADRTEDEFVERLYQRWRAATTFGIIFFIVGLGLFVFGSWGVYTSVF